MPLAAGEFVVLIQSPAKIVAATGSIEGIRNQLDHFLAYNGG